MKRFRIVAACLTALPILSACVSADTDIVTDIFEAELPVSLDAPFAHSVSDIKPDPGITYGILENGVRYAVMENDTPSGTGALYVRFDTGSINETEAQRGLAHFLEHMAFNGTKNVPEGEMIKRLERYGLSFGADTNAHTSFDETVYKLSLPTLEDEVLDEAFFLMNETARHMTLAQDAIDRERGIIHSEKRTRDSAAFQRLVHQIGFFTEGSGLVERLPIGTDETIDSVDAPLFEAYYRDYYHPENVFLVFVGDAPEGEIISRIEATFSDWQPDTPPAEQRELSPATISPGEVGYYHDPEIMTSIQLSVVRPYVERPDTVAQRKADFIQSLGNRILSRRFRTLADASEANFLSASAGRLSMYKTIEGATLNIRPASGEWESALATAEQEVRRALEFGFTQAEVDEQIARSRVTLKQLADGADTRPTTSRTGGLVAGIVNAFANDRVYSHPADGLARFETYADQITAAEVSAAFADQWRGFDQPVTYLATSEPIEAPGEEIAIALAASQTVEVSPLLGKEETIFAYTDFGPAGRIVSETYNEAIDAYFVRFENNVLLNFKQTDFQEGLVFIRAAIGDGALSMPRKDEGLRRLAYNLLYKGGLEAHSADEIETLTAGKRIGASLGVWPTQGYFRLNSFSTPEYLADAMNLATAYIIAPGYRERAQERYLTSLSDWFPTHDATPSGVVSRYVPRLIRSGDERFGFSDLETFLAPTIDDVKAWVEPQLDSGLIEISIVGDIDKDTVVSEVARTFGALPERASERGSYPDMTSLAFPEGNTSPVELQHAGEANQALVRIYWPAPDASDTFVTRKMRVLQSIFRNRLVEEIREGEAAAYSPGVGRESDRTFPDYGYIFVSLDLTPDKVSEISEKTFAVAADLQEQTITQDEFDRAITPILEDLDASLENNSYWMAVIGDAQTEGQGLLDHASREDDYKSITLEDLNTLAATVFINEAAYSVVALPEESPEN